MNIVKCKNVFCCENNHHLLDGCMDHKKPENCVHWQLFEEKRGSYQVGTQAGLRKLAFDQLQYSINFLEQLLIEYDKKLGQE